MIDYSTWKRKKLFVTSLKLDDQNPRLPNLVGNVPNSQAKIIDYLVEHESVYELAKKIAAQGYFPNEEPIVYKEKDKYMVLEGNRRVAACKILLNIDLLKSPSKQKALSRGVAEFNLNQIKRIEVRIAPSREAADIIIVNRHTEGSSVEKWDKTKQDRFFQNRVKAGESIEELSMKFNLSKSDIRNSLKRHNIYEELLNLHLEEETKERIKDETKFNMTNVERFYTSKYGSGFLAIEFNNDGGIIHLLPKEEYTKRLKRIAIDVVNDKLNSRSFGDEKQQKKYLDILATSNDFDLQLIPNRKYEKHYEDVKANPESDLSKPVAITSKNSQDSITPANKLIPSHLKWHTKIERADAIFKEIKSANLSKQFNSVAVLFRSYLDMVMYQFLYNEGAIKEIVIEEQMKLDQENEKRINRLREYLISLRIKETDIIPSELKKVLKNKERMSSTWVPSLKHMLVYLAKSDRLLVDQKLRQALISYVKGNDSFLDHNDFNLIVHNEYFISDMKALKKVFGQMRPILDLIIGQINEKK